MCELCELKKITKWYYENDDFVILNCKTCGIPMVVTRKHIMEVGEKLMRDIELKVREIFGDNFKFRKNQRKIKDHWHWHIILEGEDT